MNLCLADQMRIASAGQIGHSDWEEVKDGWRYACTLNPAAFLVCDA
jgi:hypothetical protein